MERNAAIEGLLGPGLEVDPEAVLASLRAEVDADWAQHVDAVLRQRTRSIRVVFEAPGNLNNVWACLRTMDSFGVQHAELIDMEGQDAESSRMYAAARAQPWVSVRRWRTVGDCVSALRAEGCRILALDLDTGSVNLEDLLASLPPRGIGAGMLASESLAVVLGTELHGVSLELRRAADFHAFIPMCGMSQSFNMSAACATLLSVLDNAGMLLTDDWSPDRKSVV